MPTWSLGCDLVVTAGIDTLRTARRDHTQALVNSYQVMPVNSPATGT